ncbi:hypothetical protein, partial [Thermodesulfovibrio yellowstonii]|uniref:hypothetical protein n=1 Tax=Thermodesulfovibrio yellowstonii TaxID=28262 RepID=UPI003C7C76A0
MAIRAFRAISVNLPKEFLKKLSRTECFLLDIIGEMAIKKTFQGRLYTKTLLMSQNWLAKRLGKSREWVSKCLRRLEAYGFIEITRRKKPDGTWATNIYKIGQKFLQILGLWRLFQKLYNHVNSSPQEVASIAFNNNSLLFCQFPF